MSGAFDWLAAEEPKTVYIPPVKELPEDETATSLKTKKRTTRNSLVIETGNPSLNITSGSGLNI